MRLVELGEVDIARVRRGPNNATSLLCASVDEMEPSSTKKHAPRVVVVCEQEANCFNDEKKKE